MASSGVMRAAPPGLGLFVRSRPELVAALPAEDRPPRLQRAAGRTAAGRAGLSQLQQAFDLAELAVDLLEPGGLLVEDVQPVVVASGHLVGHSAEVPLQLGESA